VQAHKLSTDPELVEGGQLLALFIDADIAAPDRDKPTNGHDADDQDADDRDDSDRDDD